MSLGLIGKNAVIYAFGNIALRMAAFLLIPIYTHSLSVNEYGCWAIIQLTMQMMIIFTSSGMQVTLIRFTKEFKEKNRYGTLLGTSSFIIFVTGIILTAVSFMLCIGFFRKIFHLDNVSPYLAIICLATLLQSLVIHLMTYYRAGEQVVKFMVIGILSSIVLILSNAIFIFWCNYGVMGALWAFVTTYLIFFIYLAWDISSRIKIEISGYLMPKLLKFGCPLIFSDFSLLVLGSTSVYMLSYFFTLKIVAVYSLGSKLASVLQMVIILPFQLAFGPFVFLNMDKPETKETISRIFSYLTLIVAFAFFGILFCARLLLPIIAPPEYSQAFLVILLVLPGITFIGIYFIGETLLGAVKKTHVTGILMLIFAAISIGLNYFLIPLVQWYGAVIATNISYVLAGVTFLMLGKKKFPFFIEWKRVLISGGIIIFFFLTFFVLAKVPLPIFTVLSLLACAGSILILFRLRFFSLAEKEFLKKLVRAKTSCET